MLIHDKHRSVSKFAIIAVFGLLVLANCGCDLINGSKQSQLLWSVPISEGLLLDGSIQKIPYKNGVVCIGKNSNQNVVMFIDDATQKIVWQWSDLFNKQELIDAQIVYARGNNLIFSNAYRTYSINLDNGETLWRTNTTRASRNVVTGIGTSYFLASTNGKMYRGDINTGQEEVLFTTDSIPIGTQPIMNHPIAFISSKGEILIGATHGYTQNRYSKVYFTLLKLRNSL